MSEFVGASQGFVVSRNPVKGSRVNPMPGECDRRSLRGGLDALELLLGITHKHPGP